MSEDESPQVEGPKEVIKAPKKNIFADRFGRWVRRIAWVLICLIPLYFIISALGTRWGWWNITTGIVDLPKASVPLIIVTLIAGVISLFTTLLSKNKRKGLLVSAVAILVPAAAMGSLIKTKSKVSNLPFIHDITTDTQSVPAFTKTILELRAQTDGVNSVDYIGKKDARDKELYAVLQTRAYPDIRPLILSGDPAQVFGQALATTEQMGWTVHTQDIDSGLIEATATSFWYGFKDDIIIRIRAGEGGGSVLDMRSISRVGQSDLGANAKRIRKFVKALN